MSDTQKKGRNRSGQGRAHKTQQGIWQFPTVLNVRADSLEEAESIAATLDTLVESGEVQGIAANTVAIVPAANPDSAQKVDSLQSSPVSASGAGAGDDQPSDEDIDAMLAMLLGAGADDDPFAYGDDAY